MFKQAANLEELQQDLTYHLPEYSFSHEKKLFAKYILAKKTGMFGAVISVKDGKITVRPYNPPSLAAAGGALAILVTRMVNKKYFKARNELYEYLNAHYQDVEKKS